jgi:CheY-like chemotaxis protein
MQATNRPLRILCADDNTVLGEIMLCLFAQQGHWVEHVNDGLHAWSRLSQNLASFDVVVTDHQMPRMTGLGLAELLRQANYRGKIVVHSSSLTSDQIERYRAFGATAFIMKAARAEALLEAVETCGGSQ